MEQDEVIRMLMNDEFHQAMMAAPLWKYFAMNKLSAMPSHAEKEQK